jgi:hypothetical protein
MAHCQGHLCRIVKQARDYSPLCWPYMIAGHSLVIGNAAVNVCLLISVYDDERQCNGRVGGWGTFLSHTLSVPLD